MQKLDWRQWIKDKGYEKLLAKENLILLVLGGVLLFVIAMPSKEDGTGQGMMQNSPQNMQGAGAMTDQSEEQSRADYAGAVSPDIWINETAVTAYASALEKALEERLSMMVGVGKTSVMITMQASAELILEKEMQDKRTDTDEKDASGGVRKQSVLESEDQTIYRTENGVSEPYVIQTICPKVEGVLVVAQGAGSGTVNRTITEIVQALFGLEAHKIQVVRMEPDR
jgi:stage III sporulation protein AG